MLVEIGHRGHEPTLGCLLEVDLRGIWIHDRGEFVAGLQIFALCGFRTIGIGGEACHGVTATGIFIQPLRSVQPVFGGHILCPGMLKTAMVENHVHDNLQSFRMSLVAETLVVIVRAETGIHLIIIGGGIAVIGGETVLCVGRVILEYRCKPEGSYAELLEVIEVFADAIKVTTMAE